MRKYPFVGRIEEREQLEQLLAEACAGRGGLVLVSGEAGVGKTALVNEVTSVSGMPILHHAAMRTGTAPYEPIVAMLRAAMKAGRDDFSACGRLTEHLGALLPELDLQVRLGQTSDLTEAVRCAFGRIATGGPIVLFFDDLQWADDATVDLLTSIAPWTQTQPMAVIGAYRSDELPRVHPVRRLRAELRRAGELREIYLPPLELAATCALVASILGRSPTPRCAETIQDWSQGLPFLVEELTLGLEEAGGLKDTNEGMDIVRSDTMPLPNPVRDAVYLRTDGLSDEAREALDVAAVAGTRFDLAMVAELVGGEAGVAECVERALLIEPEEGYGAFRHALTREAIYRDVPWSRRRRLHLQVAEALQQRDATSVELAGHWLAAGRREEGRQALLAAVDAACSVSAYRDGLVAARRALDLWPPGQETAQRVAVLEQLARCAELSGELGEAAAAWEAIAEQRRHEQGWFQSAQAQRRLAAVYELRGMGEHAIAARQSAAEAFLVQGLPGEAAAEHLVVADRLEAAGSFSAGLELATTAASEARAAARPDLEAMALGLQGQLVTELGNSQTGLETIRQGLSIALDRGLAGPAAEVYFRLAGALTVQSDHRAATDAYHTAIAYCQAQGEPAFEHMCVACLGTVLFETGEWDRAAKLCRDVLVSDDTPPPAPAVAAAVVGAIEALRGRHRRARRLLVGANAEARQRGIVALDVYSAWGLAVVDEASGNVSAAAERCRQLRKRWEQTEERYYIVPALRWSTTFFAQHGAVAEARVCAEALAGVAAAAGGQEALAALAHALGECALIDGKTKQAIVHFEQALDFLQRLELPYWRAHTQLRTGVALLGVGDAQAAADRLASAYRIARKLVARPLAGQAASELAKLDPHDARLGQRGARDVRRGGLSRRELEVLQLLARGLSNREIARELFLSPRTVEMHVSKVLAKLDCTGRVEAALRGRELGLLSQSDRTKIP